MIKNISKILLIFFCVVFLVSFLKAETLKNLKEQLKKDEANQAALVKKQKDVQSKINSAKNNISSLESDIERYEKEIDSLLSFLQISKGDNIYLEYVFEAKTFIDFIY